ncbi:MAG: tetratricopeptide repeat protein [Pyrinomonadaceae bacterium]|nr:tetratricopeptide repeat protein [Acidobacteriota bacterium]
MSWRRLITVALTLVLVFNASTVGEASGKSFLRALAAPFRAIGKLFGGGRKSNAKAKASEKVENADTKRQPAAGDATQPLTATTALPLAANGQSETSVTTAITPGAGADNPTTGAAIASPPLPTPVAEAQPSQFAPFVEGVARDPVSQGRALLANGHVDQAIAELSIAAATGLNLLDANNLLGLAYDRKGLHKEARAAYERVLSVAPDDVQTLNNLGFSLYRDNQPQEAVKRLKQAARRAPANAQIAERLALVYGRLGKHDDAYKTLARVKGEFAARLHIAAALQAMRREREALKHLEAARRLQPESPIVLERLVLLYERVGQLTEADTARRELAVVNDNTSKKVIAGAKPE